MSLKSIYLLVLFTCVSVSTNGEPRLPFRLKSDVIHSKTLGYFQTKLSAEQDDAAVRLIFTVEFNQAVPEASVFWRLPDDILLLEGSETLHVEGPIKRGEQRRFEIKISNLPKERIQAQITSKLGDIRIGNSATLARPKASPSIRPMGVRTDRLIY